MRTAPEKQLNMDDYKIVERKGHHTPNSQGYGHNCGCEPTTSSGNAYRDKVAERTGKNQRWDRIRFYHQAPVVKKNADMVEVDTHGFGNHSSTRERINQELPHGFKLVQRDFEAKLMLPNGDTMELPTENFRIISTNQTVKDSQGETLLHYTRQEA